MAELPASGNWLTTRPADSGGAEGSWLTTGLKPACLRALTAACLVWPTTLGTWTLPVETKIVIAAPYFTCWPGVGDWASTLPAGEGS